MEDNKFNNFYSKQPVSELIEQLLSHRIYGNRLEKEWFEALKVNLVHRELNEDMRMIFEKILNTEPEILKKEEKQLAIEINSKREIETNSSYLSLKKSSVKSAGKSLKNIVYTALGLIVCKVIGIIISVTSTDLKVVKNCYLFIEACGLISTLLILNSLYQAGDYLEKS